MRDRGRLLGAALVCAVLVAGPIAHASGTSAGSRSADGVAAGTRMASRVPAASAPSVQAAVAGAGPTAPVLVPLVGGEPAASTGPPQESPAAPSPGQGVSGSPAPTAPGGVGAPLDAALVRAELAPLLSGGALGAGRAPAQVVDVATGDLLYTAADQPTATASTMKLVTALSVLDALGPDSTLATRTVVLDPDKAIPRVVVVGGGDPSLTTSAPSVGGAGTELATSSMRELAQRTVRALAARGVDEVRVGFDASLFTGPALHPSWQRSFPAAGIVAPVSALVIDQGRVTSHGVSRTTDPAGAAAATFAAELERAGIRVRGTPKEARERTDSVGLATVSSASMGALVERMLGTSDNDFAEILARLGAHASGLPASFEGVAERAAAVLAEYRIGADGARFADGSGLSRQDALAPSTLTDLLLRTGSVFGDIGSGLPVAGATGSLHARFDTAASDAGRGVVRAKTGTLTGVVGLVGYASRPDGRLLAFAILDDSAPGSALASRAQVDRALARLVSCPCTAG